MRTIAENDDKPKKESKEEEPPLAEPVQSKKEQPPPPAPTGPPPPYEYPPRPPFNPGNIAGNTMIFISILLGLILMLVGSIISSISIELTGENIIHALTAGSVLFNIGGFFIALFFLIAGIFRTDLRDMIRLGLLIVAGLVLVKLIVSAGGLGSLF